ncbi:MAG: twin-arginine translocase subunit TatC, partial [Vampirovibrio sp.]|nr:twin-arginine translocase subunit TatC [Vampirovibrio sp.]
SFTGLVSSQKLIDNWRWALISIFVLSAIVTPSQDPFSMVLVASALTGLYLISLIPMRLLKR